MEESRMKKHVTVVGAIQVGFSALWLLISIAMFFVFDFAKGFVEGEEIAVTALNVLGVVLPVFFGVMAIIGLAGGIGVLTYKGWARILTIIVSALGCFNIPIGTLIGVYSIWVLMQDETVKLFKKE